ncbi:homoserine kinase [Rathayibacter sp. PhB152]|uniref:homoserine kinase n=1 Tax=Rathayibacter sp. PhB152 TaxID=2485190 RepID=UPI000F4D02E5|nr:homoserine kinase [Rathayibacter sp. PhB152]ROQ63864.1 homoserine kinase [Rathayibacter sp. PhB152]
MTSAVPVGRTVHVKVPATSANLGPGFDTLGLALSAYDELEVTAVTATGARVSVHGVGEGEVPTDETNLVVQAIAYTFADQRQEMPGIEVTARNIIPHGRGMGSSGAAIVSGIMAAKGLLDGIVELDSDDLLRIATEMEGHPDNVAPALFGGLTIAWVEPGAEGGPEAPLRPRSKKLMVHRGVSPVVFVPEHTMSTRLARSLQPISVPHEDAVFNVSRSSLLIAALIQSPELLFAATEDKLHQNYRAAAMPQTSELIALLRSHGYAAVVSGAGPSVLVLCSDPAQRLAAADLVAKEAHTPWRAHMLAVDFKGATVGIASRGAA